MDFMTLYFILCAIMAAGAIAAAIIGSYFKYGKDDDE